MRILGRKLVCQCSREHTNLLPAANISCCLLFNRQISCATSPAATSIAPSASKSNTLLPPQTHINPSERNHPWWYPQGSGFNQPNRLNGLPSEISANRLNGYSPTRSFSTAATERDVESRTEGASTSREPEPESREFASGATVNVEEAKKFQEVADLWWDTDRGPFAALHSMSPVRCQFVRSAVCDHFGLKTDVREPFAGLKMLDVGCGGGLLCEPLARMGAEVTGVDVVTHSIQIASAHAQRDAVVARRVKYRTAAAETLAEEGAQFDVVLSLEVIEHVNDVEGFVHSLAALTRPGGVVVLSTLNRTATSYLLGIVAAEKVLQWVPKGTHKWSKFVQPDELAMLATRAGLDVTQLTGMVYNPITTRWTMNETQTEMNYLMCATKPSTSS